MSTPPAPRPGAELRGRPGFVAWLALTLAAATFNGLAVFQPALIGGIIDMSEVHFVGAHHRVHDVTFGFLFVPTVVGVLAQLRGPSRNLASQLMALVPAAALLLVLAATALLSGNTAVLQPPWVLVFVPALAATVLHPAGAELPRTFGANGASRALLALTAAVAVPLLVLAGRNAALQAGVPDDHAALGHYGFVAAFALTVLGVAVLAALRPVGWEPVAGVAGLLPVLFGVASLTAPAASSSLGRPWAIAAVVWGLAFLAVAARDRSIGGA